METLRQEEREVLLLASGFLSLKFFMSFTAASFNHLSEAAAVCTFYVYIYIYSIIVSSRDTDSVRPHRWQPTRLPCPWDSPGKNTGVDCHFLLQCMKVKSESEVAQSCPTLSDPMDCSPPGSSVHGIFQARVLEWGAIVFAARDTSTS